MLYRPFFPCLRIALTFALFLVFVSELQGQSSVTFNNQVVRIFQQHCQVCHRPGNIAPFPLLTYQDAVSRSRLIRDAVESKLMPPWKPVNAHGVFKAERALTDSEIATIVQWASNGAPEGSPSELPPPVTFPDTWSLSISSLIVRKGGSPRFLRTASWRILLLPIPCAPLSEIF